MCVCPLLDTHTTYDTEETKHYVINLRDSTDRWKHMSDMLAGYNVERIEAVNGHELDLSTVNLHVLARANLRTKTKHSHLELEGEGSIGCYLSHIECWKRIAASSPAIVLEDDVVLVRDLRMTFEGDLVFLGHGYREHPTRGLERVRGWAQGGDLHFGSYAYYITPTAAAYLLENAFPMVLSVDHYMWTYPDVRHVNAVTVRNESNTIAHFPVVHGVRPVWHLNVTIVVLVLLLAWALLKR